MKRERTKSPTMHERIPNKQSDSNKSYLEKVVTEQVPAKRRDLAKIAENFNVTFLGIIYNLALLGATDEMIARALGITPAQWAFWKRRGDVAKTLKEGKINADTKVAEAMYHAAIGYSHEDEVILSNRVKEFDEFGRIVREYNDPIRLKTIKHYPPNAKLILRWLQLRQPEIWADKRAAINQNIININAISANTLSNQELALLGKLGLDKTAIGNGNFEHSEIVEEEFNEEAIEYDDDNFEGSDEN